MAKKTASVIWLHGLGDSGAGWSSLESQLRGRLPHVRWLFPNAPTVPVTCNGGARCPSWFDLPAIPVRPSTPDHLPSFESAVSLIHGKIDEEISRGVPASRIVVGGFSQGAALALGSVLRYPQPLAAGVVFSGWVVGKDGLKSVIGNSNLSTPILWVHGLEDGVVTHANAREGVPLLTACGVSRLVLKSYEMEHSSCDEEMVDLEEFLVQNVAAI